MNVITRRKLFETLGAAAAGSVVGLGPQRRRVVADSADDPPLRQLADLLGMNLIIYLQAQWQPGKPRQLWDIGAQEFNTGMAFFGMDRVEGQMDMEPFHRVVDWATARNMKFFGHPLAAQGGLPGWINADKYASRGAMIEVMTRWIRKVAETFRGQVYAWTGVNEYGNPLGDLCLRRIGPDYPEILLEAAREADPDAILLYNDGWNHVSTTPQTKTTHELIERLYPRGLIDAVGVEFHTNHFLVDEADSIATMKSYGVPVFVTEFDCNLRLVPGTRNERFAFQAEQYRRALRAALACGVKDFVVFGLVDRLSAWETVPYLPNFSPDADACPFDDDFMPKPAYFALREVLQTAVAEKFKHRRTAPVIASDG
ncbi:MAG: endo-1,4-beta-xylanase [Dehalococcoidia bacterium]|nr:endo-1,4-beta-xylanase [Dehalococcoidia bacterium]